MLAKLKFLKIDENLWALLKIKSIKKIKFSHGPVYFIAFDAML